MVPSSRTDRCHSASFNPYTLIGYSFARVVPLLGLLLSLVFAGAPV
jgi:hypothetical protein